MLRSIDINCDLGELEDGSDLAIMPFVSSCNIACGGHAGNIMLMQKALREASKYQVKVGAHPGYPDRENFGRISLKMDKGEMAEMIFEQLSGLRQVANENDIPVSYVKLHGALYHDAAKSKEMATVIMRTIADFDPKMGFLGLAGTYHESAANACAIDFFGEAFIDRRYGEDGKLLARSVSGSILEKEEEVTNQLLLLVNEHKVLSKAGNAIPIIADSICIHGDHDGALERAKKISMSLRDNRIEVKSFLDKR